ncbi:MAG: macro domain-containing protein [Armatimonadota bacterium]|nr:macro domain-containing protein [Armatimonadota bacterium]MDR7428411.1 macro domain-containing protein [Armatimonadota bacterium]MDR7465020.1 macro domain-containing protein [Armatimonadota bacterium]MDR7475950.1 macro domain-containing protein [Armatimonadota bacterium]MDR7540233.1 macro domain-containing protein [Armatimonadota bacterium]
MAEADITTLAVDAIVNAANTHLWMGGGVAGAIKRQGGEEIEREAVRQGPIPVGEAIVTGAGRLPARAVIHAATMGPDLVTDERAIRAATRNALVRAAERRFGTIALPALGTGVGGFPLERAAAIMLEEIVTHIRGGTSLREIVLAVRGEQARQAFSGALRQVAPEEEL